MNWKAYAEEQAALHRISERALHAENEKLRAELQRRTEALKGLVGPYWEEQWFGESKERSDE